jgi:hypothetical protein
MNVLIKKHNGQKSLNWRFLEVCHILGKHCLSNGYFEFLILNSLCKNLQIRTSNSEGYVSIIPNRQIKQNNKIFSRFGPLCAAVSEIENRTIPIKICFLIEENEYFSLKRNYLCLLLESNPQRLIKELKILCDTVYLTKSFTPMKI